MKTELIFDLKHWTFGFTFDTLDVFHEMRHFIAVHFGPWCCIVSWLAEKTIESAVMPESVK